MRGIRIAARRHMLSSFILSSGFVIFGHPALPLFGDMGATLLIWFGQISVLDKIIECPPQFCPLDESFVFFGIRRTLAVE